MDSVVPADLRRKGLTFPPERPAALVTALASGKYDALSGLYLTPFDDLYGILSARAQIEKDRLHSLQIRTHKVSAPAAAIATIRENTRR
jgi:hypothetical protein